jgi:caspase domain-containing protein
MNKHALVIGSQTGDLLGVGHDVERMCEALGARGFHVDRRFGRTATRDGILAGYDALIARASDGDAAVLYYSGHGTYATNQDPTDRLRVMQAIVPTDYLTGSETDFRGITAWELSIKLAQLTARTRNVTVILDCCHSSQMTRDGASHHAVPRALPHPAHLGFRAYLARLERMYGEVPLDPVANRDAVRVVACGQTQSAFEYTTPDGRRTGAFTEALLEILGSVGEAPISWTTVGAALRKHVSRKFAMQRPDVEGPSERQLFSLAVGGQPGIVSISSAGGQFLVHAGRITGASLGDTYGVMPLGSTAYDGARAIAKVQLDDTGPLQSVAVLTEWKNGHAALPADAVAVPIVVTATVRPVTVVAPEADRARLAQALRDTRTLRIAEASEEPAALATLHLAGRQLTIEDRAGPLFSPTRDPQELQDTIKNIANLGVAQAVRELVGEHGMSAKDLEITWGIVENGQPRAMPDQGASLGLGDRIYVSVRNTGHEPRYVHIFNIGVRGKVTLLTRLLASSGVMLERGDRGFVLGERDGALRGLALSWPDGLSQTSFPRLDEIFVFVTSQPIELKLLETQEHVVMRTGRESKLQALLAQIWDASPKDLSAPGPVEGYLVKRLSYLLHPRKAAMADTVAFQIDDNPLRQAGARAPDAWLAKGDAATPGAPPTTEPAPGAIAIRIGELVVEANRALFSADIRIDALVCTRSANQAETFAAHTMRYEGIKDGDRLPLDHARIFHGPVRDFVDICLWVTRDTTKDRDLADLFKHHAQSPQFHDAASALLVTAGLNAPWITAVGASAVLARLAYDLILGVENKAIGLYRTSFLAREQFGVGRHPATNLYRAQDFSFSLVIDAV